MAEFLHHSPETTTALLISYTPTQSRKFKVWKKKKSRQAPSRVSGTQEMLNKHCFLLSSSLLLICHVLRYVWSHFCLQILLAQYVSVSYLLLESLLPQVSNTEGVAMATTILWLGVVIKPQEAESVLSCRCPQNHRAGRVSLGRTLGYEILGLCWARVEIKPAL